MMSHAAKIAGRFGCQQFTLAERTPLGMDIDHATQVTAPG